MTADATHATHGSQAPQAPQAPQARLESPTLAASARFFASKATPRILVPLLAVLVALRVQAGSFGWRDALLVVVILGLEPFTEWVIHVYVLHAKPITRRNGKVFDLHAARKHREHHRNPNDPDTAFVPLPDLAALLAIVTVVFAVASWFTWSVFLTAMVTGVGMLLTYEWTHFLMHTAYKPKGRYYRSIWRSHRLHHFKNEHYWMGVTVTLGDRVLGTYPDKSEVENSPTARTLGVTVD